MMIEEEMLQKKVWAVVGATQNPDKYGYKLYRHLKNKGYRVYAVNPNYPAIGGDPCYKDLSSLPERPEVVDMVVAPKLGRAYIEEAARLGIPYAWFQPGSCDEALIALAERSGIKTVQACVLISAP